MARAALKWRVEDLAQASNLSERTINAFETGLAVRGSSLFQIRAAFEKAGVAFHTADDGYAVVLGDLTLDQNTAAHN